MYAPRPRKLFLGGTVHKSIRLLIVEDSEEDTALLIRELRKAGYDPSFERVQTAHEMKRALESPWDAVMADQRLPNFSGTEALEILRGKGLDLPFFLVSGMAREEQQIALMRAGAHDCVMKDKLARLGPVLERGLREAQLRRERTHFSEALKHSEDRYQRLVEVCPDCLLIVREGQVAFVNPAGLRLLGALKAEEIMGRPIFDFFEVECQGPLARCIEQALSDEKPSAHLGEHRLRRLDETSGAVEIAMASFHDRKGTAVQLMLRDIGERRELERELLATSEREQQRLGRDLHDGLGQQLIGVKYKFAALEQRLKSTPEAKEIRALTAALELAVIEAHNLAHGLSPVTVDNEGLATALKELASHTMAIFGVKCLGRTADKLAVTNARTAGHVYRIAQESIANAVKHGRASRIFITLSRNNAAAILRVTSNGQTFPGLAEVKKGMGLRIMQYRAGIIGATLEIAPRRAGGTRVTCRFLPD